MTSPCQPRTLCATGNPPLYYVGPSPTELRWERPVGTHQIGFQDQRGKARNKPTLSKLESNATPESFAQALIDLATNSRRAVAA